MSQDNSNPIKLTLAWLLVGIPLVWGFWMTLMSAAALFR
jgi:hypothetical protein